MKSSDLRSKLKSHEIESDHARQRDALHAQQQIREARAAHEKLVEEKRELEDRLRKLEERNMDSDHQLNDMTSQISQLSETKAINDNRLKDLTMKFQSLENQLQLCQQRERGILT
jgi:predicted nuclease with TOPRIM domain